jgi:hypothetical protein
MLFTPKYPSDNEQAIQAAGKLSAADLYTNDGGGKKEQTTKGD